MQFYERHVSLRSLALVGLHANFYCPARAFTRILKEAWHVGKLFFKYFYIARLCKTEGRSDSEGVAPEK